MFVSCSYLVLVQLCSEQVRLAASTYVNSVWLVQGLAQAWIHTCIRATGISKKANRLH